MNPVLQIRLPQATIDAFRDYYKNVSTEKTVSGCFTDILNKAIKEAKEHK